MAKPDKLEASLDRLARARENPTAAESLIELRAALKGRSPHVTAKAAQIAGECEIGALVPDLVGAFDRLLPQPAKSDPGCAAKTAIVDALQRLSAPEPGVYLRGICHIQPEPVWGGRVDTAVALRGASGFGLVAMGYPNALTSLADLLADPEAGARAAAARAIAAGGSPGAIPLLRFKALAGDEDAGVLSECFSGLLQLAPAEASEFVGRFLRSPAEEKREAAALALGSSRRAEALPLLREWWEQTAEDGARRVALLALAMLKLDDALDFLLRLVAEAPGPTARQAIAALALHRYDEALVRRVRTAAEARVDVDLRAALAEELA